MNKHQQFKSHDHSGTPEQESKPSKIMVGDSKNKNWSELSRSSLLDLDSFWGDYAQAFSWSAPWQRVMVWDGIHHSWFVGGRTNITINALDRHAESDNRNRAAYIWLGEDGSERVITYGQLHKMVCRFGNGLKSTGVKKGDRVIVYMPLTIEGIVAMLACARIGAVHSVVYAGTGHAALRDRIQDAQARVVITGDIGFRRGKTTPLKAIVDEAIDGLTTVDKVIVFARNGYQSDSKREVDFSELMKNSANCPAEEMGSEDPLFILYTSGSTGKPKGVVHVHGGYMVGVTWHLEHFFEVDQTDLFWVTSDIGWIVGHSYIVYAPLCAGVTTLFREGAIDFPRPDIAWDIVERYGVTRMFTSPTAIRMFMRYGEKLLDAHELKSLKVISCAGEPLNPEAWRWAQKHLAGDGKWGTVIDNWWQTELGAPTIGTPANMPMRPGKTGIALPGCDMDVVDDSGKSTGPGIRGHLVLRRPFPHMMRSIFGSEDRYEREWARIPGCYVTGDLAETDSDGYFALLGREDDVLNVAGHRIGTAEVENALVSHPAVAEAAVIGITDLVKGECIKAFVQARAGYTPSDALIPGLLDHVRRELGPIATPAEIEFVAALPKTRSGKIMRRLLKARQMGADPGDLSTLEE